MLTFYGVFLTMILVDMTIPEVRQERPLPAVSRDYARACGCIITLSFRVVQKNKKAMLVIKLMMFDQLTHDSQLGHLCRGMLSSSMVIEFLRL